MNKQVSIKNISCLAKIGILFLSLFMLLGCSSSPRKDNTRPEAWLTRDIKVDLPQPTLAEPMHDQQLLTVMINNQPQSLIALVDADGEQLSIAGVSTLGIRLFKIQYQNGKINTEQAIFIPQLPPATQVLSDIMLSYWPTSVWQKQLPENWQLIDTDYQRKLYDQQHNLIMTINYSNKWTGQPRKPNQIIHHIFDYQIDIKSMEK